MTRLILTITFLASIAITYGRVLNGNPCKAEGFFPIVDNTPQFYGCFSDNDNGFVLEFLSCIDGHIFNSKIGSCIPKMQRSNSINFEANANAADDDNILGDEDGSGSGETEITENPDPETTTDADITSEITEETEIPEEPATSEAPEASSTSSSSNAPETTENTEVTDDPEESETTEDPEEDQTTDAATTEEPVATTSDCVITDEPSSTSTSDPEEVTTDDIDTTADPTSDTEITDEPSVTTENPNETTTTDEPAQFVCQDTGFFAQENSCDKFIYCRKVDGVFSYIELQCPAGQNFNPILKYCEVEYDCEVGHIDEDAKFISEQDFECLVEGDFPHQTDCSKYYTCSWSTDVHAFVYEPKQCRDDEVFDLLTGNCGQEELRTCAGRPEGSYFNSELQV